MKPIDKTSFDEFKDQSAPETISYSPEEEEYYKFLKKRITAARDDREQARKEFNYRSYTDRYNDNMEKAYTLIAPLENEEDTSIDAGVIRFKVETLMAAILNLNFKGEVRNFDKASKECEIIADASTDMIFKSREMEGWDHKKPLVYWELISQGNAFLEEVWVDETRWDKKKIKFSDITKDEVIKTSRAVKEIYSGCRTNLLAGTQYYPGDINEPTVTNQPYLFTREEIGYEEAKAIYGKLPRFKYVPKRLVRTTEDQDIWVLDTQSEEDRVEVIKYQDKWNDDYQIILNGVMMLQMVDIDGDMQGFPMPWEYGEYNITKGDLEPIHAFYHYSKSLPEKLKYEAEVYNELSRIMILLEQKKAFPPIANNNSDNITKNDLLPASVMNDIDPDKVGVVGGPYGVDNGTINVMKFLKEMMNEKSISNIVSGISPEGKQTATEISALMQQAKQQLGLILHGFISLHENIDTLRFYNILENWTKPLSGKLDEVKGLVKDKYREISLEKDIQGKGRGNRLIRMTEELKGDAALMAEEQGLNYPDATGQEKSIYDFKGKPKKTPQDKPLEIIELNPKEIRNLKTNFFIEVTPSEKDTSLISKASFQASLMEAIQIWPGIQNNSEIKERWARNNKFSPKSLEVEQPVMAGAPAGAGTPPTMNQMKGADIMSGNIMQ